MPQVKGLVFHKTASTSDGATAFFDQLATNLGAPMIRSGSTIHYNNLFDRIQESTMLMVTIFYPS